MDIIEDLLLEYLPTIIVVAIIVGTYLYMNKPPPPPPVSKKQKPVAKAPVAPKVSSNKGGKVMKIFFGTQTRTAEDFSHVIEKEAKKIGIECEVVDLESYPVEELADEYMAMFIVSTHGEGDPTDNAKEFYNWLVSDERQPGSLSGLPFTVFGLGNKTYEHFNAVARVFDKRLEDLGGKRVFERGEGDDDATLEEDFIHWKKNMWVVLCQHLGYTLKSDADDDKFVPRFRMIQCNNDGVDKNNAYVKVIPPRTKPKVVDGHTVYDIKHPYLATVIENRELHGSKSDRSCRHIELDFSGTGITYTAGDHLGVYPDNEAELVERLIKRLGFDGDQIVALVPHDKAGSVVEASFGPMTVRKAFTDGLDITNPPRKAVIRALADYTNNIDEKKHLIRLASEEGSEEYNSYIKHDFRSIGELLDNFPGVAPPLAHFLELLPRLPARYYSISSSMKTNASTVTITAVVTNFKTPTGRHHNGVCSTWLSHLQPGSKVPIFVRESHFRLPSYFGGSLTKKQQQQQSSLASSTSSLGGSTNSLSSSTSGINMPPPMIMIGPGTGLAPFRGFLQEMHFKQLQIQQSQSQTTTTLSTFDTYLYFGCRGSEVDYLYREELERYHSNGVIKQLTVAYSRESGQEKVYVQHKLLQDKQMIWEALSRNAYFYVCGDARNMAKSVQQTLISIVKEFGSRDDNEAQKYIDDMQKSGRYLQDVWF